MGIFVLILGCLQNFLDIVQLESGEVLLKGLLGGRVGVWEGFVCCGENGGIDISHAAVLLLRKPVHATPLAGLSYHDHP